MQLKNNKEKKGMINVNTNFKKFFCIILACIPLPPSLHGGKYDPIAAFNDYNIQIKEEYEKNNPQKGPTSQQNAPTSPATGDDRNVTLWLSLVLLCGAFVVVLKKTKPYSNK